jgi:hypothetical protein
VAAPKKCPDELRARAVRLYRESDPKPTIRRLAEQLNVHHEALRSVRQAEQPCDRDLVDLGLLSNIYEIWEASGRTYGADRVYRQLRRDGIRVGRNA